MGAESSVATCNNDMVDKILRSAECKQMRTADEVAMRAVDRRFFLPKEFTGSPYKLAAVTHECVTISSPLIYANVLKQLELQPGDRFLNIGSGSGYFSCIAGILVADYGANVGLEIQPQLVEYSKRCVREALLSSNALSLLNFVPPKFYCGNLLDVERIFCGKYFNKIYCGFELSSQAISLLSKFLSPNGILVAPWTRWLNVMVKNADTSVTVKPLHTTVFEPMINEPSVNVSSPRNISIGGVPSLYRLAIWELRRVVKNFVFQRHPGFQHYHSGCAQADCASLHLCGDEEQPIAKANKKGKCGVPRACLHLKAWECFEIMEETVTEEFFDVVTNLVIPEHMYPSLLLHLF
uniref:Protein-L-isoaspartate O-methyltransferase n=1 Tax=Trichuris muris TaxID=70415 RepID=A0A5S6QTF1_TRIMR